MLDGAIDGVQPSRLTSSGFCAGARPSDCSAFDGQSRLAQKRRSSEKPFARRGARLGLLAQPLARPHARSTGVLEAQTRRGLQSATRNRRTPSAKRKARHRLPPKFAVKHPASPILLRGAGDDEERLEMLCRRMTCSCARRVEPLLESPVARVAILEAAPSASASRRSSSRHRAALRRQRRIRADCDSSSRCRGSARPPRVTAPAHGRSPNGARPRRLSATTSAARECRPADE